jgi:NAD-dependent deacetylase
VDHLLDSTHTVALTGPEVSRESGVPEFRIPGKGLWTMVNPVFFTLEGFKSNPAEFYRLGIKLYQHIQKCSPNVTHFALAELQRRGLVRSIITQNIDGLHQRAGSDRVYEVNGNMKSASCLGCARRVPVEELAALIARNQLPPLCEHCGSPLKPDVVLFDEGLAPDYTSAINEARAADLLLFIGADMRAAPANLLPYSVKNMIIVNKEASMHDHGARVIIHGSASEAIRAIMEELNCRKGHPGE